MAEYGRLFETVETSNEPQPSELLTGGLISLRFITNALRRGRRFWIGLAVVGLIVGLGYHSVAGRTSTATATLYLAHAPGGNDAVESANDVAMVRTFQVGQKAAVLLGQPTLSPLGLLGKAPAKAPSSNVLVLTVSGPTPAEAVKRVNAVASAYLAFRGQEYGLQNQAIVNATNQQIGKFQSEVAALTTQINGTSSSQSGELASLISQRSTLQSQITSLEQTVQTDNIDTLSISQGSRVLTAGTLVPPSKTKSLVVDGVAGLIAGLALGMILLVLKAILSDRLWRREDIAAALGAPVELSIGRVFRKSFRRRMRARMATRPRPQVETIANFLHSHLVKRGGSRRSGLFVAIDDPTPLAVAASALAARLAASGRSVVLVDATLERVLGRSFKVKGLGTYTVQLGDSPEFTVVIPPNPWETESDSPWRYPRADWSSTSSVLIVANVDPAYGASHLRRWGNEAVVSVTAGRSSAQRINMVAELLEAAQVSVTSGLLLGVERSDESVGLPDPISARTTADAGAAVTADIGLP